MLSLMSLAGAVAYSPASTPRQPGASLASQPARFASMDVSVAPRSAVVGTSTAALQSLVEEMSTDDKPSTGKHNALMSRFTRLFCGHFDNLAQVEADLAAGLTPREGGGHEHIHCHLQRMAMPRTRRFAEPDTEHVLATYYFNGQPERVFRQRIYALRPLEADGQFGECIQMQILRLRPQAEDALRAAGGDASRVTWDAREDTAAELRIPDCDVFWQWHGERFEGNMRTESIVVHSPVLKRDIVVRDDVALWEGDADGEGHALWCNDRGADLDGNYVYGNINDVPYKMSRVDDEHWTCTGRQDPVEP